MTADVYSFRTPAFPQRTALTRRSLLAAAATSLLFPAASRAQTARLALRRGGSIHSMLNWPELEPGSKENFAWPPFASSKYQTGSQLLTTFKRAGLDFIRLTVDPGIFLATSGARRDELDAILLSRCRAINEAGLSVIVDFHPISQVASWRPERIITDAPTFAAFVQLIGRTAKVLQTLDASRIALEFFNEPPYGYDGATSARWQRMLADMHRAARASNPDIALVISGAAGGGIRGLLDVDARSFRDDNIYWSFHYYSPHLFTHQGVETSQENMRHFRYLTDLPYPASDGTPAFALQTIRQAIHVDKALTNVQRTQMEGAATEAVRKYFDENYDAKTIAAEFDKVVQWGKGHGIPNARILLGEFGAARRNSKGNGALNRHRENWLHDVRTEAERRSFAWALWDIDDAQMGLVTRRGSGLLDPKVLNALGLNAAG